MTKHRNRTKTHIKNELARLRRERKEAEEALRESEERYRCVIDNIGVGVALISPDMEILSLNNQMKRWFPDIETSEKPICYRSFNNPPRETICSYCPTYKTLQDGQVYESITDTPTEKGTVHYRIISSPLTDREGNIIAAIEMVDDITEQKRLNMLIKRERETFFSILQKAPYGIVMMDKNGKYLYSNEEFTKITGYRIEDVPTGREWFSRAYPDEKYRKKVIKSWKNDITKKGISQVFTITCKDDKQKEIEFKPYLLDDGRFIVMLSDISKRKRAERALKKAHDELEQRVKDRTAELENINEELRAFNYSVSHDLKIPVIAIEGYAGRLIKKYSNVLDEKGLGFLKMIHKSSVQMRELIDDLLAFFSMGRKQIEFSYVNLEDTVSELFNQIKSIYTDNEIEFHIKPLPYAYADTVMIRQVFANLINNAIKFSKTKQKAVIEIGGWTDNEKNTYYIKDNGIGFPMDHADRIFEFFERIQGASNVEGSGIGLAIVKRIIQRHGGEVWAESRISEGATFYFTLPNP